MKNLQKGQQIATKPSTGENSHIISIVTITGFEGLAIHVQRENGERFYINSWDICPMPKLTKSFK